MRCSIAVLAILCFGTIGVASKPNQSTDKSKKSPEEQGRATPALINNSTAYYQSEYPKNDPPKWYASPEWWLVAIAGITGFMIWIQAREIARATRATEIAAKATLLNAQAFINSERAWILVEIGKLPPFQPNPNSIQILWIFPTIKNFGKTPARIKRIAGIVKLIPAGQNLPSTPEYIVGQGFDDKIDLILPPENPIQPRLGISGDELLSVRNGKMSLFIHGFIEYFDGLSKDQRRTAYCFAYVIQSGYSPAETGFYPYLAAPIPYTECT